jgi:hypothetical protein
LHYKINDEEKKEGEKSWTAWENEKEETRIGYSRRGKEEERGGGERRREKREGKTCCRNDGAEDGKANNDGRKGIRLERTRGETNRIYSSTPGGRASGTPSVEFIANTEARRATGAGGAAEELAPLLLFAPAPPRVEEDGSRSSR